MLIKNSTYKVGGCFKLWLVSSHQTFRVGISRNVTGSSIIRSHLNQKLLMILTEEMLHLPKHKSITRKSDNLKHSVCYTRCKSLPLFASMRQVNPPSRKTTIVKLVAVAYFVMICTRGSPRFTRINALRIYDHEVANKSLCMWYRVGAFATTQQGFTAVEMSVGSDHQIFITTSRNGSGWSTMLKLKIICARVYTCLVLSFISCCALSQ